MESEEAEHKESGERESVAGQVLEALLILAFWPLYLLGWLVQALWRLLVRRDI